LDVAYAYVAKFAANSSYVDSNGYQMSRISEYPSAIIFNITRLPGVKISACDAIIEVYGVHITTNTGKTENYAYIVGTNYSSSFSPKTELSGFIKDAYALIDRSVYLTTKGDFNFNWTDNSSILSHKVGSIGLYTSLNSTLGLWSAGKPNDITISVERLGYLTFSRERVSIYKDIETKTTTTTELNSFNDGFLHNTLVPTINLKETNLFEPVKASQYAPIS
jgi:hypothetical protein